MVDLTALKFGEMDFNKHKVTPPKLDACTRPIFTNPAHNKGTKCTDDTHCKDYMLEQGSTNVH